MTLQQLSVIIKIHQRYMKGVTIMFIALNCNGERISIENAVRGEKYFCPLCGAPLIIRATESLAVKTHFAHKRGTPCIDNWKHDMSEWHYNWQCCFPKECREFVVVNKKTGIKHRADIFINNTVIEFQHSPITADEIAKRNDFYLDCGYNVVWVFDATDKIKNSIEETIDPMKCGDSDLCWKRAKQQFSKPMPPQVTIFLQYKSFISNQNFPNQLFDLMLPIKKIGPKGFTFQKTIDYIIPLNFLKEFGITLIDESVLGKKILSVTDILNKTNQHIQQPKRKQATKQRPIIIISFPYRRPTIFKRHRRL